MAEQGFTLSSPDFVPDGIIPMIFTCDGANTAPALKWIHAPNETQSFALIVDDPDAPKGTFTHWVLFDIPADRQGLPSGSSEIGVSGRNDFQHEGYGGPCPPPNHGKHRYYFKLFALNVPTLGLEAGASRASVEQKMEGHVIQQAVLMGRYERRTG